MQTTRNAENKNPDIIEWEEVEDTDYEYELAKMVHEERMVEVQSRQSTADAITSVLNLINTTVTFLDENPEVLITSKDRNWMWGRSLSCWIL